MAKIYSISDKIFQTVGKLNVTVQIDDEPIPYKDRTKNQIEKI